MLKFRYSEETANGSGGYSALAEQWFTDLLSGEYDKCYAQFDETMSKVVTKEQLPQFNTQVTVGAGAFDRFEPTKSAPHEQYQLVQLTALFTHTRVKMQLVFDGDKHIAGLNLIGIEPLAQDDTPNAAVAERDVTVDAGANCPLPGKIARGVNASGRTPAVVIVHGSGPQDMDLTIGPNKPYRQLSDALAERGITVLRYEKRTHKYGASSAPDIAKLTINDETVDDAVAAVKLLQEQPDVDPERVFVIGHSLGGMVAPAIAQSCDVAGLVIMAGTPRKLWEVMYDQNQPGLEQIKAVDETKYAETKALLDGYAEVAKTALGMDDETAAVSTVFGQPAWYMRSLDRVDSAELLRASGVPAFIAQGSDDFQVYADKDFALWKTKLAGCGNITFKLYEGLNHMFMPSPDDPAVKHSLAEYSIPAQVSAEYVSDIAEWMHSVRR